MIIIISYLLIGLIIAIIIKIRTPSYPFISLLNLAGIIIWPFIIYPVMTEIIPKLWKNFLTWKTYNNCFSCHWHDQDMINWFPCIRIVTDKDDDPRTKYFIIGFEFLKIFFQIMIRRHY